MVYRPSDSGILAGGQASTVLLRVFKMKIDKGRVALIELFEIMHSIMHRLS